MATHATSTRVSKALTVVGSAFEIFPKLSERVASLDGRGLRDLGHATRHLVDALCAFSCQPRFRCGDGNSPAGDIVCDLIEALNAVAQLIHAHAYESDNLVAGQADERGWAVLAQECEYADDLGQFAVLACQIAVDASNAGRRHRIAEAAE